MLTLFNSLTEEKETLKKLKDNQLSIYVCGITPYDTTHLGHAFTYISFDVLIKYLAYLGTKVDYTQNVTDINDRDNDILKKALEQKTTWKELSDFWTNKFLEDMEFLNWTAPTNYLFASKNIEPMIKLIQKLISNGFAYEVLGNVYLDVTKIKDFGKLSKLTEAEMLERSMEFEEDVCNPNKKHPLDVTLWRASTKNTPPHIPSFDSPFGKGRPGWHIECSAMSTSTLGEQIDIHGGGIDLIYPHHESEIAQSEGATLKKPFAQIWMHTALVAYKGLKMSKSEGNLVMISDLSKKYSANEIRFLLLSHHYRMPWEYSEEKMKKSSQGLKKIEKYLHNTNHSEKGDLTKEFEKLMDDDLNTPSVLSLIMKTIDEKNIKAKPQIKLIMETLGFII